LLKPAPTRLRVVRWSLAQKLDEFPESPHPGLVTVPTIKDAVPGYYAMAGYRAAGERAIRIDMLERLADMLRDKDSRGGFEAIPDMLSITGMTLDQFADLMTGLGYKAERGERPKVKPAPKPTEQPTAPDSAAAGPDDTAPEPAAAPQAPAPDGSEATPETAGAAQDAAPSEPPAPELEVFYTFTWAGRAARQNSRPQGQKPSGNAPRGKGKPKGKGQGAPRGDKPQRFSAKPGKPEKKIDPDNPFAAALAGFKKD